MFKKTIASGIFAAIVAHDVSQKKHAVIRNFPVVGHLRYLLEEFGPELRQYIVTSNNEERPFSRDQRRWVYASAKNEPNTFGFGSDDEMEERDNFLIIKPAAIAGPAALPDFPGSAPDFTLPSPKIMGGPRKREKAFRPHSVVNISGMSFGALSANAITALNKGAAIADCLQNTGEGGISPYHQNGGKLIFQIGTGYFGCRNEDGTFSLENLKKTLAMADVKALEIKMSQGAKPGLGGMLPASKVTEEIAAIRGVKAGENCVSPHRHSAFSDADTLLDFVEHLAKETGLPVGVKSAVGDLGFWQDLAELMVDGTRGVDFITIDGGEGGTGAAPLVFSDHVALPFKLGFSRVYKTFAQKGVAKDIVWIGSGKLGFPQDALAAFAMGADMINVGREAMLSIGCIQAQRCHTGNCPTGVATQNAWLMRGLDPTDKSARLANYVVALRSELVSLARSCGYVHPRLVPLSSLEIIGGRFEANPLSELLGLSDLEAGLDTANKEALVKTMNTVQMQADQEIEDNQAPIPEPNSNDLAVESPISPGEMDPRD